MQSNISYSEYKSWCLSRLPGFCPTDGPPSSSSRTIYQDSDESCPVTVRSLESGIVIVPVSRGSR